MCARNEMAAPFLRQDGPHGRNFAGPTSMRQCIVCTKCKNCKASFGRPGQAPIEPQVYPLRVARHRVGNDPRPARMIPKRASSPVGRLRTFQAAMTGLPSRACGAGYRAQNRDMNGDPATWLLAGPGGWPTIRAARGYGAAPQSAWLHAGNSGRRNYDLGG